MRILFLTYRLPYPPVTGDRVRVFQHIKLLYEENEIYLLSFYRFKNELEHIGELERYCKEIFTVKLNKLDSYFGAFRAIFNGMPLQCGFYASFSAMKSLLSQLITQKKVDMVYISLIRMAPYKTPNFNIPYILDYCDALSLQTKRRAANSPLLSWRKMIYYLESKRLEKYEKQMKPLFEETLITSSDDAMSIDSNNPPVVIPNYYEIRELHDIPEKMPYTLAFSGDMAGIDNVIAIEYFYKEIFPLILQKHPQCKFYIIGANPSQRIFKITKNYKNNTIIMGYVDDMEATLSSMQVYVCPLKTGTGIKNRVLQAMGVGMPIISTSWGNKGINAVSGRDMLIADTTDEFVAKVLLLLNNSDYRKKLGENAKRFVAENFSPLTVKTLLFNIIKKYENSCPQL